MNSSMWLPYYVLWQQRQRQEKKEKEQAEKEAQEALRKERETQEESQKAQEQPKQEESTVIESVVEQKPQEQPIQTKPKEEEGPVQSETKVEEPKTEETPKATTIVKPIYTPKATDCELLYEIGTPEFATCDYSRAQSAQANSNIAMMLMFCVMAGIGIAALVVHHIDRSVDEKYRGGGYYLG